MEFDMRFLCIVFCCALTSTAIAQDDSKAQTIRTGPYLGVQPGANDSAPGKTDARSRGAIRQVTWVGFQMKGPGGRVFIQSTESPQYDVVASDALEVVLELKKSRLHTRNEGRPLDTTFFPTAVQKVTAKQLRGNVVRVTIQLSESVGYDLRQEGQSLFLDFRPLTQPQRTTAPISPNAAQ